MKHLFDRLGAIAEEMERIDKESSVPEGEDNPALKPLIEEGNAIVAQLNPLMRELYRDQPETLAEWESALGDHLELLAEDEKESRETEAAKESETLELAAEINAVFDRIDADMEQFLAIDGPDLRVEKMLERNFAALHELDGKVRRLCSPEQVAKWNVTMGRFAEVEERFERGRELEKELEESEPAN